MQEQHISGIISKQFDDLTSEELAQKIKQDTFNLPDGARTPTPEEVKEIRVFRENYVKNKPMAKNREIRRAIERKFKIKILPNK